MKKIVVFLVSAMIFSLSGCSSLTEKRDSGSVVVSPQPAKLRWVVISANSLYIEQLALKTADAARDGKITKEQKLKILAVLREINSKLREVELKAESLSADSAVAIAQQLTAINTEIGAE